MGKALTRYILDVYPKIKKLIIFSCDEPDHFCPSCDSFDEHYKSYVKPLEWRKENLYSTGKSEIRQLLKDFDFLMGDRVAPAFLKKADIKLNIFLPYGADLYHYPFLHYNDGLITRFKNFIKEHILFKKARARKKGFSKAQREGIKNIDHFIYGNAEIQDPITILGIHSKWVKFSLPMVYTNLYNPEKIKSYYNVSQYYSDFRKIRNNCDVLLFSHIRQYWVKSSDSVADYYSNKANDVLIRAFSKIVHRPETKLQFHLVLFEYGPDVGASKDLINSLGISQYVTWMPLMPRKEIMIGMSLANLVIGELNLSNLGCGASFEAMALAKPLLGYREDEVYLTDNSVHKSLYPMMNAHTEEEVCQRLIEYTEDPERHKKMGIEAMEWHQKEIVDKSIDFIIERIEQAKSALT